jgi:hypothetical protein
MKPYTSSRSGWAAARRAAVGALGALSLAACSDLLEVEDPEFATPETISDPAAIPNVYAGALGLFAAAYSGEQFSDAFINVSGLLADEIRSSDTFPTRNRTDRRDHFAIEQGNTADANYLDLQQARRALRVTSDAIETLLDEGIEDPRYAETKSLEGFIYLALGEGYCSGVPFSSVVNGEFEHGVPLATDEIFTEAVGLFDAALAGDPASHLAAIGKARALVNLGGAANLAAAATAVADVPTEFVYFIRHSETSARLQNAIWAQNTSNARYTMANSEGTNGLNYRAANDPRTPWADIGVGFDNATPLFAILRYPESSTDVPLATGVEARLIEAEAAVAAGQPGTMLTILNDLRADVGDLMAGMFEDYDIALAETETTNTTLAPLTLTGAETPAQLVDIVMRERAFWLYMTGHRLGDLRRLIRDYGRTQDQVFPVGVWSGSNNYGNDVALPLDFDEQNNPNWEVEMCNVDQA